MDLPAKILPVLIAASLAWSSTAAAAPAEPLTFKRLYAAPGLEGPQVASFKFSPDGSKIAFLKSSPDDNRRYDLWLHDIASKQQRLIVAAASLADPSDTGQSGNALSDDERARRERQRIAANGIVSFDWSPAGDALMIPWKGQVAFYRLASGSLDPLADDEKDATPHSMSNPALSPVGNRLAYVSGNDLYVRDLESGKTKRLTKSRHPLLRYGIAEFVAAEEIGRDTGFWWSPDGSTLAVIEVDGRGVPLQARYEMLASGWRVNHEPYPQAGAANVKLRLALIDARSGRQRWLDLDEDESGPGGDFYLSRIKWLYDSSGILVSRQSRDQKRLDVLLFDRKGRSRGPVIQERAERWINLHNDLIELSNAPALLWGSDRDGRHRIYRYGRDGKVEGALTPANLHVDAIINLDEERNRLYVEGYDQDPRERHLYHVDLDPRTDDKPQRLTLDAGLHNTIFSPDGTRIIDRYTSPLVPYRVSLRPLDGGPAETIADGRITPDHPYSPYNASHVPPEYGTLTAADGSTLYYNLLLPRGLKPGQRVPVLINVYGGPGYQMVTKSRGPLWQQVALARGYAVFMLDNRGSARRGKAFEEALYKALGSVEVSDQLAGLNWLKSRPEIDPARIAVFGWSYGGYMALKLGQSSPDIRAVVSGAPVTDWRLYDSHYTERFMGMPQDNAEAYDTSSVFPALDRLTAPLLLIHGLADDNVLFDHSARLMAALQQKARPFAVMTYPGATHSLREPVLQQHLYETIFDFLDEKLR